MKIRRMDECEAHNAKCSEMFEVVTLKGLL